MSYDPVNTDETTDTEAPTEDMAPATPVEDTDESDVAPAEPVAPPQPLKPVAPAAIPFTSLAPSEPTRLEAVANDITAANARRVDAETQVQSVRDRIAQKSAETQSLESELATAQVNVTLAKENEVNELREGIQILQGRLDTLQADIANNQ